MPPPVIPGPQGSTGSTGITGANGSNAFTTVTTAFTMPASAANVTVVVGSTLWMAVGQPVFIASAGFFLVAAVNDAQDVVLTNLGYSANAAPGTVIASAQHIVASGLIGAAGASGSGVTSVGLSVPSVMTVSGSPVTTNGTLAVTFAPGQTQDRVLATPDGAAGAVALIALTPGHIPALNFSKITAGTVPIAQGGTGQSTQSAAFNALSPLTTKGDLLTNSGTGSVRLAIGSDTNILVADSTQANGLKWAPPALPITSLRRRATVTPDVMLAADIIVGISVAGAVSETLIAAPSDARTITIKDESGLAGTNNITVFAGAGDTIQGAASKIINTNYGYLSLYYDAADKIWFIDGSA